MDFRDASLKYARLKQHYDQGQINAQEFERQANDITVTDSAGVLWQIGVKTGQWYRFDGQNWVEDTPPGVGPPAMPAAPYPPPPQYVAAPPPPQYVVAPRPPTPYDRGQAPSRRSNWFWIVGGLGALALVGCIVVVVVLFALPRNNPAPQSAFVPVATTQGPGNAPQASASSPQAGPIAGPGFDPNSIFVDDFSDPASGWDRETNNYGSLDYANGMYRIVVNASNLMKGGRPHKNFNGDVGIEVDATKAGGPDDNMFGVICRYRDTNNLYRFMISSDGYALIARRKDGQESSLSADKMQPNAAILKGVATNHIRVTCLGSALSLFVNHQQVATATDGSFSSGDVGLMAGTFDNSGVEVLFDNFLASAH